MKFYHLINLRTIEALDLAGYDVMRAKSIPYSVRKDMEAEHFYMSEASLVHFHNFALRASSSMQMQIGYFRRKNTSALNMKRYVEKVPYFCFGRFRKNFRPKCFPSFISEPKPHEAIVVKKRAPCLCFQKK